MFGVLSEVHHTRRGSMGSTLQVVRIQRWRGRRRGWHRTPLNGPPGPPHAAALAGGSVRRPRRCQVLLPMSFAAGCRVGHGNAGMLGKGTQAHSLVGKLNQTQNAERR